MVVHTIENPTPENGKEYFLFFCPGCKRTHQFDNTWTFNKDFEKPTLSPSYLTWGDGQYKDWGDEDMKYDSTPWRCHSFIKDGMIQFLGDCTHELKNKTVPLEKF